MDVGRRPAGWGLAGVTGREALKVDGRSDRMNEQERQRRSQKGRYMETGGSLMGWEVFRRRQGECGETDDGADSSGEGRVLYRCCIDIGLLALFWSVSSHGRRPSVEWSRRRRRTNEGGKAKQKTPTLGAARRNEAAFMSPCLFRPSLHLLTTSSAVLRPLKGLAARRPIGCFFGAVPPVFQKPAGSTRLPRPRPAASPCLRPSPRLTADPGGLVVSGGCCCLRPLALACRRK
jgi:hypothetical protein